MARSMIGSGGKLSFEFEWESLVAGGTSADATWGALVARVGSHVVWGNGDAGFSWTWIELLEFLTDCWTYLQWEEGDPLGLGAPPTHLRSLARDRWEFLPEAMRAHEEEVFWAFEHCHNLAHALQGARLPDLWVLREGRNFVIAGGGQVVRESADRVLVTLGQLGDVIAGRARLVDDDRSRKICAAWETRSDVSLPAFVSVLSRLEVGAIQKITGKNDLAKFWDLEGELQDTELLAAARMLGAATPTVVRRVVNHLRSIPVRRSSDLDQLSIEAKSRCDAATAFEQGQQVALWLRNVLQIGEHRVDPEQIVASWNVRIADIDLQDVGIDAISCWGPRHGPAILINTNGRHAQHELGRRASVAHEIGHLLLDRDDALPLAEVLGGHAPRHVEARARAFGAELLLPRSVAGQLLLGDSSDPPAAANKLRRRFGVSREIVCWQARNSGCPLPKRTVDYIESVVSEERGIW